MEKWRVIRGRAPTGAGVALLALAVASLVVDASGSCFPPPPGLVGWWPGDGNTSDIIGTNNGALQGAPTPALPA